MPDTGAPWYIPYVSGTDLVSDWPTDSQELADAIADGLDAAGNAGIGSNVVQTAKTDSFTTSSTTYTAVTGLTATITPTSASSKVLVMLTCTVRARYICDIALFRGVTQIAQGDSSGNWKSAGQSNDPTNNIYSWQVSAIYLDSPSTTSATTYSIEVKHSAATPIVIGQDNNGTNNVSELTLIEVAA